jgi:tagaturonate reductase
MEKLNRSILKDLKESDQLILPKPEQLDYPEKVLQFGTGVLLRGLPDFYIDEANRRGQFQGRVVVVKTTQQGSLAPYHQQDCLYSICMRGKVGDQLVNRTYVNASISRVLSAQEDWASIKEFARSSTLQVVISNTTEVGIVYEPDKIFEGVPTSFPGKLLSLLYERYVHFKGDVEKGLIILPAELIEYNGDKLRAILKQLIEFNNLEDAFQNWFDAANVFCNTLVDRIVPGKLSGDDLLAQEVSYGYTDELMISCEPFGLWVIESNDERVKRLVAFADEKLGCKVVPSIHKYKELKLRMLNATHTFSCALSILAGIDLVKESMSDQDLSHFIKHLLLHEIKDAIQGDEILEEEALSFGNSVLDRFANPFLEHRWESISAQYALKMKGRCIPLITTYWKKFNQLPDLMLMGLSAFLIWEKKEPNQLTAILSDEQSWGTNLDLIPGLKDQVHALMLSIQNNGVRKTINNLN